MNIQPKRILWPTDFSDLSLGAVGFVRQYHRSFGAQVHVIHVCVPLPDPASLPVGVTLSPSQKGILNSFLDAARRRLKALVDDRLQDISPIVSKVLSGHAWPEICAYAGRTHADLIIVATHGLTGLRHAFLGSTAERIVQHAPCPVLTVKAFSQSRKVARRKAFGARPARQRRRATGRAAPGPAS